MSFVIWFLILAVLFSIFGFAADKSCNRTTKICILVAVVLFLSPIFYEYPSPGTSQVVTFEGDKAIVRPYGAFCFEWGSGYSNLPITVNIMSSVSPVTDNPKVRKISYTLKAVVIDPEKFYQDRARRLSSSTDYLFVRHVDVSEGKPYGVFNNTTNLELYQNQVDAIIAKIVLYETSSFNNRMSKQLAMFYNPFDSEQVYGLKNLVESEINKETEKEGIKVQFIRFVVE